MSVILAPGTGAGTSDSFHVRNVPIIVSSYGGALASDTGALEKKAPDGGWDAVYKDGVAVTLSATNPHFIVVGSGEYRIDFAGRTNAVGVTAGDSPAA